MKKSILYTKTGDGGMTSLVGGMRVSKIHPRLEAYGTADELNSLLGLLITYVSDEVDGACLFEIQRKLFSVGSYLATDLSCQTLHPQSIISPEDLTAIESAIDTLDANLPSLHAFVIPGGTRGAAICHLCRTVCRRLERRILVLANEVEIDPNLLAYINRLSDYLFVLARKINNLYGGHEILWQKSCK